MFNCDKCGKCCRHLELSPLFDDLNRGDGVCKYLNGNLCSIYEDRPMKCRVDETYNAFLKDKISIDDFYHLNYEMCKTIKKLED